MRCRVGPAAVGVCCALAWVGGVALQLQQAALWAAPAYGALFAGALAMAVLAGWGRSRALPRPQLPATWLPLLLAALATAAAGFASTGWRAEHRWADALPAALEGQDLQVTGVVAGLPQTSLAGTRFLFDIEQASQRGQPVVLPRRVSLGWYRGFDVDALLAGPAVDLRAGQRWQFTLRLRQPHGTLNPAGFDLELWLFEQGIRASGQVRATLATPPLKLADDAGQPVQRLRQALRDRIEARVGDASAAGVLAALAIGDQAAIDRPDWELFRVTGVAHLMSISGLHVTMFAWLAGAAIGTAWRWRSAWMLALPAPMAARWGGLAAAAAYAVLAGWGVPAQRTVWMIATVVVLQTLGIRWPPALVLAAAGVVVTALDPWALVQPGFWLSFVAVGLLMGSEPVRPLTPVSAHHGEPPGAARRIGSALRSGLRTQLVATVGLAPLTMVFFQQVSLVGFVANLLAIPLVTLLVTPLALLGVLLPPLWALASAAVQGLMVVLGWLAGWPGAIWTAAVAPPAVAALGLLGAALAVMPLPWRLRLLAVPLMLPLLLPALPRPAEGRFELLAVDVGQGTAVLLRTRQHLLVYDTGPAYSPEADAGERVLLPLLRARGEQRIDLLMLSHRDSDHVGGAATLLARFPVQAISSSLEAGHPLLAGAVPQRRCQAGERWVWDGVQFELLHPPEGVPAATAKPNTLSCVLRVQGLGGSVLLTGDLEAAQEAALVLHDAAALKSDVLLVPHHGSKTSSSAAFLDAVAPRVAVVQAGYRSRYGHPASEVLARYTQRGITLVRSDTCGAWTQPAEGAATCERQTARRYWHHPGLSDVLDQPVNPVISP